MPARVRDPCRARSKNLSAASKIPVRFVKRWPSVGCKSPSKPSKEQKALGKSIGAAVKKEFDIGQAIGDGKDAWVVRVQRRSDKHEFALKVFNGKKPSAIKKEVDYQGQAAKLGLSPQVVSNWDITEKNRCFAMVKLDHTLKDLVRDQSILILTKDQQSRMIQICKSLSQAGILYNDAFQIKNNLMVQNGKLYLIDYGKSISSPPGDHINTQILVEIDDLFRDEHEEAKRKGIYMPMFAEEIRQAEIETGETFDYAAKFAREKKDGANKENPQEVVKSVSQATTLDSTQITKSRKKRKLSAPKKPEAKWMQVPTLKQLKIPAASEEQTLKRQHQENGRLAGAQVRTYNLRRRKRKR